MSLKRHVSTCKWITSPSKQIYRMAGNLLPRLTFNFSDFSKSNIFENMWHIYSIKAICVICIFIFFKNIEKIVFHAIEKSVFIIELSFQQLKIRNGWEEHFSFTFSDKKSGLWQFFLVPPSRGHACSMKCLFLVLNTCLFFYFKQNALMQSTCQIIFK